MTYRLIRILFLLPVVLISLPFHEAAHAYAAYKLGDPTAYNNGRLTLNPLKHLDPVGVICLLFGGFGWAKPVPVNYYNFRNPKKGFALTALAGPISNLILAALSLILLIVCKILIPNFGWNFYLQGNTLSLFNYILYNLLLNFTVSNIMLAVFNLIPIPPLDGSRLLAWLLPNSISDILFRYERYIHIALLALIVLGAFDVPLGLIQSGVIALINLIV